MNSLMAGSSDRYGTEEPRLREVWAKAESGGHNMKRTSLILLTLFGALLKLTPLQAQDTNSYTIAPATKLEAFNTNVATVIIKGTTDLGAVSAKTATVSVKCKEFTDPASGRREQGIAIEIAQKDQFKDVMLIDYDELSSLLSAIDYLG
jgi:hypothetical protein